MGRLGRWIDIKWGEEIRIIAGTDFHGSRKAFEFFARRARGLNLAVICGDITNFGTVEQARRLLATLSESGTSAIFIPGNCDPPSLVNLEFNGLTCIHGKVYTYSNLAFIGLGGSAITPFNTLFEMGEEEIAEILYKCVSELRSLNRETSIVFVSHQPPKNTKLDRTFMGLHAGSTSIRRFIEDNKPLLVLCGHIHEARGIDKINDTIIVNPGPARHGNYTLVTIRDDKVNVELKQEEV